MSHNTIPHQMLWLDSKLFKEPGVGMSQRQNHNILLLPPLHALHNTYAFTSDCVKEHQQMILQPILRKRVLC